jgi:hypothetical protein
MVAQIDKTFLRLSPGRVVPRLLAWSAVEGRPATTSNQWFDRVVLSHLGAAAKRPADRAPDRPIFVLGVGRSGTTILGRILSVHPEVCFLNEPKALWHVVHPHEDVSGYYPSASEPRFVLGAGEATAERRETAQRLFRYVERLTRSGRVVDKYPELSYRQDFLAEMFDDAIAVGIVRRPEQVVASIERFSNQMRRGDQDWWGVNDKKWITLWDELVEGDADMAEVFAGVDPATCDPPMRALTEWVVGTRAVLGQAGAAAPLVVSYERLCDSPREEMARLVTHTELSPDRRVMEFAEVQLQSGRGATGASLPDMAPALRNLVGDLVAEVDRRAQLEAAGTRSGPSS